MGSSPLDHKESDMTETEQFYSLYMVFCSAQRCACHTEGNHETLHYS